MPIIMVTMPTYLTMSRMSTNNSELDIQLPYSRKYWQKLNLAVGPQIAIAKILADLNLVVRYGIAICI